MSNNDKNPKVLNEDQWQKPENKKEKQESLAVQEFSKKKNKSSTMQVKVSSPFNNYFEGQAFSVSGVNATGPFDVLPGHHNFICLLEPSTLIIRASSGEEQKINISGGLMHVKANQVVVFLDV